MRKATLDHLFRHLSPVSKLVMRVDFNVPIKNQKVVDPNRITSSFYYMKVPYQPFNNCFNISQNHLFFCHITGDLMVKGLPKIHLNLVFNPLKIC